MKVLRIYDHLGELKKEFNLYVEGENFKWGASYPEPIWLGTITIEEAGKEPKKPSESVSEPLQPELGVTGEAEVEPQVPFTTQLTTIEQSTEGEVKDEPEKANRKRSRVKRSAPSASPEGTKGLHQDNSNRDITEGG